MGVGIQILSTWYQCCGMDILLGFQILTRNVNDMRDMYNFSIHQQDRCSITATELCWIWEEFNKQRRHGSRN